MAHGDEAVPAAVSRTAVFVDYENLYYEDKRAFGPDGVGRLAADILATARECGPVTMARAIAPFDDIPGAAQAFLGAGLDPVFTQGGRIRNAADLQVVQHLMAIEPHQDIGVVFLVSGDAHMRGALQEAQRRGFRVVVVACERALSKRLRDSADKTLSIREVQAEAGRLLRNEPPRLGLSELARAWHASRAAPNVVEAAPPPKVNQPQGPAAASFQTSPSALKTFAQCPRRYSFIHVENRRQPANRYTFVGTCVHQALREFFSLGRRERTEKALEGLLRKAWAASPERNQAFPADKEAEEAEAGRETVEDLRLFFRQVDVRSNPLGLEVFGRTEIGEGVTVTGKIDRLDAGPKAETLIITDYKTGRPPASKPSLFDEFQLPLYAAMVSEARAETVAKVVLHYVKGNVKYDYQLGEPEILRAKDRALGLARQVRAAVEYRPSVSALCGWCSFMADCPARAEVEKRLASRRVGPRASGSIEPRGGLPF